MLHSKKRRRRKKKNENLLTVKKKPETHVPSKLPKSKPKLNANYKTEEQEVQSALLSRSKKDLDLDAKQLIDRQISFFVDSIVSNQFDDVVQDNNNGSEQSLRTNENVLQLASSFVQVEDEKPIEKCKKQKIVFDEKNLLYYPDSRKSDEMNKQRVDLRDDGLFEPTVPSGGKGMQLQVNRFKEEHSNDWITDTNKLSGLHNFVQNNQLRRSVTLKDFDTILYSSRPHLNKRNQQLSDMNREKILKIHIYDVTFHSHPCLNKEQILARNIENRYKQYTLRRTMALTERLQQKLNAIRRLQTLGHDDKSSDNRLLTYRDDIRDLRNHLHREQRIDRDILKSILEQWKSLKKLRNDQGFVYTDIKLTIRTEVVDESTDRDSYDRDFELELNEIFDESMEIYLNERKNRKSVTTGTDDFELIKKLVKPDIDVIRDKLLAEYSMCMRPPGEPKIFIELSSVEDAVDSKRVKNHFANSKFLLQIAFDNTILNSERNVQSFAGDRIILDAMYSVKFRSTVPMNIKLTVSILALLFDSKIPFYVLHFQIYEEKMLRTRKKCGKLIIPVPDAYELFKNGELVSLNFDSTKNQMSGQIGIKTGWSYYDEPENSGFLRKNRLIEQTANTIQSWYDNYMIDPLDPEARSLTEIIHQRNDIIEGDSTTPSNQFRLNENLYQFCPASEQSRRLNILTSRFNSHLRFKDEKFVPHEDREIGYSDGDHDENIIEDLSWLSIDVQRHNGKKYLLEVFDVIKNHCEIINRSIDLNDLIIGDNPLSFR